MKKLKVLLLSFLICCATSRENDLKLVLDLNLKNFKKHLEVHGRDAKLDFVLVPPEGKIKTFSTKKKISREEYEILKEKLENLPWDSIKERYVSKDGMLQKIPPIMISINYKEKSKNIIIIGDVPKELLFIFNIFDPYLQIDPLMLK